MGKVMTVGRWKFKMVKFGRIYKTDCDKNWIQKVLLLLFDLWFRLIDCIKIINYFNNYILDSSRIQVIHANERWQSDW